MANSFFIYGQLSGKTLTCKLHNTAGVLVTTLNLTEPYSGVYQVTVPLNTGIGKYMAVIYDGISSLGGGYIQWTGVDVLEGDGIIAKSVRTELSTELAAISGFQSGLTNNQANMLLELYRIMGLDPAKPLVVTQTQRRAGTEIVQTIGGDQVNTTTITRT